MDLLFLGSDSFRKAALLFFISMITIVSGMSQSFPLGTDVTISSNATYSGAGLWGGYTLTVKSGSSLTFTSGISLENSYKIIVEPGAKLIVITGGVAIKSTASLVSQGSVSVRAGGLLTQETATLSLTGINKDTIIGGAQFNGTSNVNIGAGTDVYIGGNVTVQSSAVKVDGTLAINGNLNLSWGQNTVFTGDGDVTTTGSMNNINSGSMFGTAPFACNTGPCSGRNFCNYANTITSSTTIGACEGASFTITANTPPTGTPVYLWQSTTTIGTAWAPAAGTNNTATYTASGLVTTTYYRRRIVRDGCTSYSKVVTVTATAPAEPMVVGNLFCSGTKTVLTALGSSGSYQWYTSATGATAIAGANKENYTTPVLTASTTYYVSSIVGSCESTTRKAVTATLLSPPAVTPSSRCGGGTVSLTASGEGGTYQWYNASNTAISGATNATYTTGWIGATTTYYVSSKYGSCETAKVAVTASILSNGFAGPAITTNSPVCTGSTLSLAAAAVSGATYSWTGPNSFTSTGQNVSRTNATSAMAGTYKVKAVIGACTSTEISTTVVVNSAPAITSVTSASRCGSGSVALGAVTSAGTINWYTGLTGGTSIATGTTYSPSVTATTTYYVDATNGSCTNASRTAVVATVNTCTITWTGASTVDWNTAGNWSSASVPTINDDVIIPSFVASNRMPSITSTSNAKSVTSSGTITMTSAGVLNVYGNINSTGTFTTTAGSTVSFNGSSAQTVNGVSALHNVKMNNTSGGVSLSSALTVRGTLSLIKGVLTTNSKLTINFDNGGNIGYAVTDAGSISGTVSGRRDLSMRTHYIAAPFSGSTSAQVQATTPLYQNTYWRMFTKDFTAQNWIAVINTTTSMPLGTGFSLTLAAPAPLILSGSYSHSASFTGPGYSNAAANKYFMVGNPYPSTLDWNNAGGWTKTNVGGSIYYWDPANSRIASYVSNIGTNGGTQYIPAMQSFMVTTKGTGGTSSVSINNAARTTHNSAYFRVAQDDVVRVTLISKADSTRNDETVIRFNELATNDFDYDLDAYKLFNTGGMPSIYTSSKENLYSINSYASVDSAAYIPVGTKLVADGSYKLKISGTNPNMDYLLVDKLLGTKQSIVSDSVYAFTALKSDDANRFELQLRVSEIAVPTGVQSASKNDGLSIYSSTKGFVLKTDRYAGEKAEIEILDMTGNSIQVLTGMNLSMGSTYVPLDMADGAYLIKVHVEGNTFAGMIALVK